MAVKVVCDFCDRPLEFEDGRYIFYMVTSSLLRQRYKHLCKSCAYKLNDIFDEEISLTTIEVRKKFAEINKARRERLGTKG